MSTVTAPPQSGTSFQSADYTRAQLDIGGTKVEGLKKNFNPLLAQELANKTLDNYGVATAFRTALSRYNPSRPNAVLQRASEILKPLFDNEQQLAAIVNMLKPN